MNDDWKAAWDPVVAQVGQDLSSGKIRYGADPIERSAVRRYLEHLEFDCALHHDPDVAREHGHADMTAPYTAVNTFTLDPLWRPGTTIFDSEGRNDQPFAPPKLRHPPGTPKMTGHFATDIELEWFRPLVVGDHLGRRGHKLLSCEPKETRVGRGAFLKFESEIVDQHGEVVARSRLGIYLYEPHPKPSVPA